MKKISLFLLLSCFIPLSLLLGQQNYTQTLQNCTSLRQQLDTNLLSYDSIGRVFTSIMVDSIFPYWYKTPWTFNGHTPTPRNGTVACGYFVSTTLSHAGLNVNRYRLAQQDPFNEGKSLVMGEKVMELYESDLLARCDTVEQITEEGLYFIGFANSHVGFLLKQENDVYVIHSNFINREGVIKEPLRNCEAFTLYHMYYIVPLSTNEHFLNSWLSNKEVQVYAE